MSTNNTPAGKTVSADTGMPDLLDEAFVARVANDLFREPNDLLGPGSEPRKLIDENAGSEDETVTAIPRALTDDSSEQYNLDTIAEEFGRDFSPLFPESRMMHDKVQRAPSSYVAPIAGHDQMFQGLAGEFAVPEKLLQDPESSRAFYFLHEKEIRATHMPAGAFDVHRIRQDFPALQQKVHGKQLVWLDNAATTHKPQHVIDATRMFYEQDNSNIHRGAHALAARATDAYEAAREKLRSYIGASRSSEIVFVRGTTEAANLVAKSCGRKFVGKGDEIVVTEMEHHANIVPWQMLCEETGAVLRVAPINDTGELLMDRYAELLGPSTKIVAFTQVSNVLGTVNPVELMTQMAHAVGARVFIDGAQSIPHFPVNVQAIDCDFFAFSGHKLFGPTGIGVLFGKEELLREMPPWEGGGNMIRTVDFNGTSYNDPPHKFEAGTHNIAGAVGLGAAIEYLEGIDPLAAAQYEEGVLRYAMEALATIPSLRLIGTAPGKVSVLSFVLDGHGNEDVGKFLDTQGIAVRASHHCAQPVLKHYGLKSSVRPSLAFYNTCEEIDALVAAIMKLLRRGYA